MLRPFFVKSLLLAFIPFVFADVTTQQILFGTFQINHNNKISGEAVIVKNDVANKPGSYFYFHIKEGLNPKASYEDYTIELRSGHHCRHNQGSLVKYDKPAFEINSNGGTDAWCLENNLDITTISMVQVRYNGEIIACTTLEGDPNFQVKHPSKIEACIR